MEKNFEKKALSTPTKLVLALIALNSTTRILRPFSPLLIPILGSGLVLIRCLLLCLSFFLPVCSSAQAADAQWSALVEQAEQRNLQGALQGAEEKFREALAMATSDHAAASQVHQIQARLACVMVLQAKLDQAQPIVDRLSRIAPAELLSEGSDDEMYYLTSLGDAYRTIGYRLTGREKLRCLENNMRLRDIVMGKRGNLAVPVSELLIARVLSNQFDRAAQLAKRLDEEIGRSKDGDARNAALFRRISLAYQIKGKSSDAAPFDQKATALYKKTVSSDLVQLSKERESVRFCLDWKMLPEAEKYALSSIRMVKPPNPPIIDWDLLALVYAAQGRYEKACEAYEHVVPILSCLDPISKVGYLRRYAGCLKRVHRDKEAAAITSQCTELSVQDLKKL